MKLTGEFVARDAGLLYRLVQSFLWVLFGIFARFEAQGFENVPRTGRLIVSPNHLHMLDIAIVGVVIPRRTVVLAADKWRGRLGGVAMQMVTQVIYVARGEADRAALTASLKVLKAEKTLAVAPEGTRSRVPGLQEGHEGAAYLASRTGAPIVPVAVWGHENAFSELLHLRRPRVYVRIGAPIILPPAASKGHAPELRAYTDRIMTAIACMLPEEYRGVYADRVMAVGNAMD